VVPRPPAQLYHADLRYYEERADGLLASARDGTPDAVAAFTGAGAPLTETGARRALAAEHGLADWPALTRAVEGLADHPPPFARAYRAVEAREPDLLAALLDETPDLVRARGTNGNDLLGMAGATGDVRLTDLLLARGADPAAANQHGWTALHQAAYGNRPDLITRLIAAGAPLTACGRGDGGTPLIVALFWGHREAAELLAGHDTAPGNLRVAAGLGDADLLTALIGSDGRPTAAARAHRAFYRPHSGMPEWRPGDDPQEILDEALAWAARSDRTAVLTILAAHGADLEADVYRGTALAWAAACGRTDAIQALVALGADPGGRSSFGGPDHGRALTPLHLAAQAGRLEAIAALLELGADPAATDGLYDSTPAGWAEEFGQERAVALLRDSA
jgi:ankyrin repeat protein